MRYLLYILAVFLIISWAIGFFIYSIGAIIHLLLVIAVATILYRGIHSARERERNLPTSDHYK